MLFDLPGTLAYPGLHGLTGKSATPIVVPLLSSSYPHRSKIK